MKCSFALCNYNDRYQWHFLISRHMAPCPRRVALKTNAPPLTPTHLSADVGNAVYHLTIYSLR